MELRHLRYFLAVAEEGQLTRAAERLAMQQPPLSHQIRLLEDELGFDLFVRLPRGVILTEAGKAFAQSAETVMAVLSQGVAHARRIAEGELGAISIGLTSSAAFHPATTQLIGAFRKAFPDVGVDMMELNAAEILEKLRAEQLHLAFLRKPVEIPAEIGLFQVLDEPMVAVLPKGHPLLQKTAGKPRRIRLAELADQRFILVRRPGAPGMYADILAACDKAGFAPHIAREVPRMLTGIHMIAAGMGITLVPASMQGYRHEDIVYCPLHPDAALSAPLHLAYPRHTSNGGRTDNGEALFSGAINAAASRFVAFVRETVQKKT